MDFTVNLNRLEPAVAERVIRSLRHEDAARHALGVLEQRRLKQLHDSLAVAGGLNALGGELRQNMVLSRDQWVRFMQVYGQKCWSDPEFAPWVLKQDQHADLRVKDTATKIQSGYTGRGDSRARTSAATQANG